MTLQHRDKQPQHSLNLSALQRFVRLLHTEKVLFLGYRWFAWLVALVSIIGLQLAESVTGLVLLLVTGILNLMVTFLAETYIQVTRQHPSLLVLDVCVGVGVVWSSGGGFLPFLPYALSALLLPFFLLGWQGALLISLVFTLADLLARVNLDTFFHDGTLLQSVVRTILPVLFVSLCSGILWLHRVSKNLTLSPLSSAFINAPRNRHMSVAQFLGTEQPSDTSYNQPLSFANSAESNPEQVQTSSSTSVYRHNPLHQPTSQTVSTGTDTIARQSTDDELRHILYDVTPNPDTEYQADVPLPHVLQQLVRRFSDYSDIDLHMELVGSVRHISWAQHLTLLRLAQVSLMNVHQHSRAQSALLILCYETHAITLTIQDNGVGLLDGTYKSAGFHSLRAMSYCLCEIGGYLNVFEGENGGVTVRGTIQLND